MTPASHLVVFVPENYHMDDLETACLLDFRIRKRKSALQGKAVRQYATDGVFSHNFVFFCLDVQKRLRQVILDYWCHFLEKGCFLSQETFSAKKDGARIPAMRLVIRPRCEKSKTTFAGSAQRARMTSTTSSFLTV